TGLEALLREHGERRLWVLGLATDYCVKATALDALRLGFAVTLVVDGCRAVDLQAGDGERAIAAMQAAGVTLATSAEVLADAAGAR
ncbi:MAG TPA: isochorismatase family protein, partial [Nannocystis sp.]